MLATGGSQYTSDGKVRAAVGVLQYTARAFLLISAPPSILPEERDTSSTRESFFVYSILLSSRSEVTTACPLSVFSDTEVSLSLSCSSSPSFSSLGVLFEDAPFP